MTMAYRVKADHRSALSAVIGVDGSCRPQIVADDAPDRFAGVLREMRRKTGYGVLLNTSYNVHGEPLVCTPEEAVDVFLRSGADALAMGPYLTMRGGRG
jgi:carbamoyltransferase